jgi:expansin (peptidoglycan-binding protein)
MRTQQTTKIPVRKISIALGLLALAPAAFPECGAGGCYDVYIEELYPEASGGAWIRTSGTETLANCTVDSNVYLRLNATAGYKEIYATLLAAQLSDKKVSIRIAEGSNPCSIVYVTLNRNNW